MYRALLENYLFVQTTTNIDKYIHFSIYVFVTLKINEKESSFKKML